MATRPWAVVTGASSGIGLDIARSLAARQFNLVLCARRLDRLEAAAAELRNGHHVEVEIVAVDLGLPGSVAVLTERAFRPGRDVHVLVNNAGLGAYGPFAQQDWSVLDAMLRLNVTTLTALTQAFVPRLLDSGQPGYVLQVASVAALQPVPNFAVYAATKSYVRDFSAALSHELRGTPVSVTCLLPGGTWSEFADTAGLRLSPLARKSMLPSALVAEAAVAGLLRRQREVVPGWLNKLVAVLTSLGPRRWATQVAEWSMGGAAMQVLPAEPKPGAPRAR